MTDTIRTTPEVLVEVAGRMRVAGAAVEELRDSVPDSLDAGAFTAAAEEVLAHLIMAAGQMAIGLEALGDAVAAAGKSYHGTDTAARDQLTNLWTN